MEGELAALGTAQRDDVDTDLDGEALLVGTLQPPSLQQRRRDVGVLDAGAAQPRREALTNRPGWYGVPRGRMPGPRCETIPVESAGVADGSHATSTKSASGAKRGSSATTARSRRVWRLTR